MYLGENLILILSPPRCGSTMLQRILGSHSAVQTHPEPHVLTPLAFQGYYYQVEKATYNHPVAAQAFREFVDFLPEGEEDYLNACRAYCSVLYTQATSESGRRYFLDKSPNYADTILPFIERLLPKAKFIVLTRHPLALFSSASKTFFGGDYGRLYYTRDLLGTFIPPIARFMREADVPYIHVRYEYLVADPETQVTRLFDFLDLDFEPGCINFGKKRHITKTYGDPKIGRHDKPVTESIESWVGDLACRNDRKRLCKHMLEPIAEEDLSTYGYPIETIWTPLETALSNGKITGADRHTVSTRLNSIKWSAVRMAQCVINTSAVNRLVSQVSRYCDVLLRISQNKL